MDHATRLEHYAARNHTTKARPGPQARRAKHKLNHALAAAKRPAPAMIHPEPASKAEAERNAGLAASVAKAFGFAQSQGERKLWRRHNRRG